MRRKTVLFAILIGIFTVYQPVVFGRAEVLKKEPTKRIKARYNYIILRITKLEEAIKLPAGLKDYQKRIEKIETVIARVQEKLKDETLDEEARAKLHGIYRDFMQQKRDIQTEIHIADLPLKDKKKELESLLREKKALEGEYALLSVEAVVTEKTIEFKGPQLTVEADLDLEWPENILINLALERKVSATLFCEIYINNRFVERKWWKAGAKKEFTVLVDVKQAWIGKGLNRLKIVLGTFYKDDDVMIKSPSFEKSPLIFHKESRVGSPALVSAAFKLTPILKNILKNTENLSSSIPQPIEQ